ncbi:MAG: response regulator transcription factor [Pyrinomonadaceae bacterium]
MRSPRRRVLCAESDDDTCEMLKVLLGHADYEVKSASTVAEALGLAGSERFNLYLLDQRFADGGGLELCEKIRHFDSRTPILFFSALAQETDRQRGMGAGAQAYLIKPNDINQLADTITRLINEAGTASRAEA